jgi:hypothetical protein
MVARTVNIEAIHKEVGTLFCFICVIFSKIMLKYNNVVHHFPDWSDAQWQVAGRRVSSGAAIYVWLPVTGRSVPEAEPQTGQQLQRH